MDESNNRRTNSDDNNDLRINDFPDDLVEYDKYDTLANTIKIEDITSNKEKQDILRQLKEDEPEFIDGILSIGTKPERFYLGSSYCPNSTEELAWLGYYIGRCTKLQKLYILNLPPECYNGIEVFRKGLGINKSIETIHFSRCNLINGEGLTKFMVLDEFLKNKDSNLNKIDISFCQLGPAAVRQLSLAIGSCINKSMKSIGLYHNTMGGDGHLVDIITAALSISLQLEVLCLGGNNLGINDCTALSTLLRSTTQLQRLVLNNNNIDDKGIEVLVQALSGHTLQELHLWNNRSITIQGWKAVSTLLEMPGCSLEMLYINSNNIGDEGALVFANALANNSTLKTLGLDNCEISDGEGWLRRSGWAPFLKLLDDTSSVNKTYTSNHTLEFINGLPPIYQDESDLGTQLERNRSSEDKEYIAMFKILQCYWHFDMQPFFEWDLKVLPIMKEWFTRAAVFRVPDTPLYHPSKINKMELSVTYDFIKEFPMLYIEPVTRKEISDYTLKEEELQSNGLGDKQQVRLEEIRQCKARAMRRLH